MIDFSQYPEVHPFITPVIPSNPGRPESDFRESPFENKRLKYINHLNKSIENLRINLESGVTGYRTSGGNATHYNAAKVWLNELNSITDIFDVYTPDQDSGNCLGTDQVWDLFSRLPQFSNKLLSVKRFEEYSLDMFDDVYEVLNQIFDVIGTRGQLFGYTDRQVKDFIDLIDSWAQQLDADNYTDILSTANILKPTFDSAYSTFKTNVKQAGVDMRSIINPVVEYIYLVEKSITSMNVAWGSLQEDQRIKDVLLSFGQNQIDYTTDIKELALGAQISLSIRGFIDEERSNLEMMVIKMVKTTYDQIDLRNRFIAVHQSMVIPNY